MSRILGVVILIGLLAGIGYLLWWYFGPGSIQRSWARQERLQKEKDRKAFEREVRRWD